MISAREKSVAREVYYLQRAGLHDAAISVLNNQLSMWYLHPYQRKEAVGEHHNLMAYLLRDYQSSNGMVVKAVENRVFIDYFYIARKKYNGEMLPSDEVIKLYERIYTSNPTLSSIPSETSIVSGIDDGGLSNALTLTNVVTCLMSEVLLKMNDAPTSDRYRGIMSKYNLQELDSNKLDFGTKQLRDKVDFNIKQLLDVEVAVSLRRACERT